MTRIASSTALQRDGEQRIGVAQYLSRHCGRCAPELVVGFLPPNNENGQGEGFVVFDVQPKAGLPLGTVLRNHASIVLDTNEAIITPEVTTVIGTPPANGNQGVYLPAIRVQP